MVNEKDVVGLKADVLNMIYYGMCAVDRLAVLLLWSMLWNFWIGRYLRGLASGDIRAEGLAI